MLPKEIIELAVKGGWRPTFLALPHLHPNRDWQYLACDPLFWQALGKELNWSPKKDWRDSSLHEAGWKVKAKDYFHLLMTSCDTSAFWKDIISNSSKE